MRELARFGLPAAIIGAAALPRDLEAELQTVGVLLWKRDTAKRQQKSRHKGDYGNRASEGWH
jgi:hypothetical protein